MRTLAHPEFDVARTAIGAIQDLPEDRIRLYLDLIMAAVPDIVRLALEKLIMKGYEYQSEFARKYYGQGVEAGRAEGVEAGRAEGVEAGRAKGVEAGRAEGLRDAVLELARTRLADLSPDEATAVRALCDEMTLLALIGALARAPTAEEARALLRSVAAAH